MGQDPDRYGGFGYGNLSQRSAMNSSQIIVTGSQTGHLDRLQDTHYCRVDAVDIPQNRVGAIGPVKPSSEVLTHARLYQLDECINAVFHIHDPHLWAYGLQLDYPSVAPQIEYGSVEMALAIERLYRNSRLAEVGLVVMRGHQDGILAFGPTLERAGSRILGLWVETVMARRQASGS